MSEKTYARVEDRQHFLRDVANKAILNTDLEGLRAYREKRNERSRINNLEKNVQELRSDLGEIKDLLRAIANNKKAD
jgi:hypothetical protein